MQPEGLRTIQDVAMLARSPPADVLAHPFLDPKIDGKLRAERLRRMSAWKIVAGDNQPSRPCASEDWSDVQVTGPGFGNGTVFWTGMRHAAAGRTRS